MQKALCAGLSRPTKLLTKPRTKPMKSTILLGMTLTVAATTVLPATDHPRLLFDAKDVPALREKIKQEPFKSMVAKLQADLDKDEWANNPSDMTRAYDLSVIAQRAGFLYVLTGDDKFAKKARELVAQRIADKKDWANGGTKGLALYWHGSRVALTYDFCAGAPSWDKEFCATVSAALKKQGDVIQKAGDSGQNASPASNWQGSRYGAGGLCLLATDEEVPAADIEACYSRVVRFLDANIGNNDKSRGWNSEGLGYTYFPMGNYVGPFGVAMARRFPDKDIRKMPATRWTYWTTFAALLKTANYGTIRPDFGDDNAGTTGEGAYGLAFYYAPEALLPGIKYVYDRFWGLAGEKNFDSARAGTIYSILYYPANLAEKEPLSIPAWRDGFVDVGGNGFFTYRNSYGKPTDMVAQMFLKLRTPGGHGGPDALSFRIQGLDTAWAVGGGRYGPKIGGSDAYWLSQNTVYPNDPDQGVKCTNDRGRIVGTPFLSDNGGGHLVSSIGQNNVGVGNHKRWFIADYGPASGAAATYVIADASNNGKFWQLCTLEDNVITTSGNKFTITAKNGAVLTGTVLYPTGDVKLKTGKRKRGSGFVTDNNNFVHCQSADGSYVVVLTVTPKGVAVPPVAVTGTWGQSPDGTVKVGGFSVTIKDDAITYSR
jgi:hypothetical protein